jgi:hypothetical protein
MTCPPCKLLFGNYYEGLELGADHLVLFGGPDACRLGYLARSQVERLRDAGFRFSAHTLSLRGVATDILRVSRELVDLSPREMVGAARTPVASLSLVEEIEREAFKLWPRESERGTASHLHSMALAEARVCTDRIELQVRRAAILRPLQRAARDDGREVFRVALLGDACSIAEPFFNMNLEERLGYLGVEPDRLALGKELRPPVLLQGGVAANTGMVRAFEEELDLRVLVPAHHEIMGAIGAAMLAREYTSRNGANTRFKGFAINQVDYATRSFECQGCSNLCEVVEIRVGSEALARWGGRCGKCET